MTKIPKIIHYCWFGNNTKSKTILKCIESWRIYAPDYEIIEWNEKNFEVNKYEYARQAYLEKKYAFVSDVARFDVLYNYGGIYLDTDVELLKPIDFIRNSNIFMGYSQNGLVASGLIMGSKKGEKILKDIINYYETNSFLLSNGRPNMTTVVTIVSEILEKKGVILDGTFSEKEGVVLYPAEYFDPFDYENNELKITDKTISIHHYAASWKSEKDMKIFRIGIVIKKIVGKNMYKKIAEIKHKIYG